MQMSDYYIYYILDCYCDIIHVDINVEDIVYIQVLKSTINLEGENDYEEKRGENND